MKKSIVLITMLLMATALPFRAHAYDFSAVAPSGQTLYYNISGNNVIVTYPGESAFSGYTGYTEPVGNLFIPSTVIHNSVQYTVVAIGSRAFMDCRQLTSVIIPNSVTEIGGGAFEECRNLTNVTLPDSITAIYMNTFNDCFSLDSIIIPNTVTSIGQYAFYNCSSLYFFSLPDSLVSIGKYAFYNCAFDSVYIPASCQWIEDNPFENCNNIVSIIVSDSNPRYDSRDNCNAIFSNNWLIVGCKNTTFPASTAVIGKGAFGGCLGLTEISLPASVNRIEGEAFNGCRNLSKIIIPASVNSIGSYAFCLCTNLQEMHFRGNTPPTLSTYGVFQYSSPQIYVPCGCQHVYDSVWQRYGYYATFRGEPNFDYSIVSSDMTMGILEINQVPDCNNMQIVVQATGIAMNGYHFSQWNDGITDNPRTFTLTQDTSFTAIFEPNSYFISTSSNDSSMGTVIGGGLYDYNTTQSLEAVPAEGHHFIRWTDGNSDNPRNILIEGDASYTAVFAIDTLTVNVSSNNMVYGTVNGGGTFVYGSPCTIEAEAYSGYVFVRWSNGVTYNPYTFAVLTNMDIEAVFAPEGSIHNVTVQVQPAGTGTVTGDGPYANGETVTLEAIPNDGYHFVRWQDDVTDNPRTIFVTTDMAFTAFFEADDTQGIVDANSNGIQVWAADGSIIIEGNTDETVHVYDMMGREVTSSVSKNGTFRIHVRTGVYLVKIGNHPIWKVVVLK